MLTRIARRPEGMGPAEVDTVPIAYILGDGQPSPLALPLVLEHKVGIHITVHVFVYAADRCTGRKPKLKTHFEGIFVGDIAKVLRCLGCVKSSGRQKRCASRRCRSYYAS